MNMDDIRILETTDDVRDRVNAPYMAQKLVPESFSLRGPFDQAGDVDKLDRGRRDFFRIKEGGDLLKPLVRDRDDTDVRLDGAKRIILGRRPRRREGVEDGRLADVGKSDDAAMECHDKSGSLKLTSRLLSTNIIRRKGESMRRRFLLLFAFLAVSSPAFSLTVLQLNLEQLTALSQKVFVGRCASVVQERDSAGRPVQVITYDVEEMIKGEPTARVTFRQLGLTGDSSDHQEMGDLTVVGVFRELPRYEVGEESVVFLSEEGRLGLAAPVGFMQGKFDVKVTDGKKTVVNGAGNRGLFIGWKKRLKEKNLVKQNGGELPLDNFVSLVKKLYE